MPRPVEDRGTADRLSRPVRIDGRLDHAQRDERDHAAQKMTPDLSIRPVIEGVDIDVGRNIALRCATARIPAGTSPGSPPGSASAAVSPDRRDGTPARSTAGIQASDPACTVFCGSSSDCGSPPPSAPGSG